MRPIRFSPPERSHVAYTYFNSLFNYVLLRIPDSPATSKWLGLQDCATMSGLYCSGNSTQNVMYTMEAPYPLSCISRLDSTETIIDYSI